MTSWWVQFNNTLTMAWVAQALLITCLAKNMSSLESWTTEPAGSSPGCHLRRKTNLWTGVNFSKFFVPKLLIFLRSPWLREHHLSTSQGHPPQAEGPFPKAGRVWFRGMQSRLPVVNVKKFFIHSGFESLASYMYSEEVLPVFSWPFLFCNDAF